MFRLLWEKKALIAFLLVLVFLLPSAVARPAQMLSKTLMTTIGVDKVNGEYVVSGEMIVNKFDQSGKKSSEVIKSNGPSVGAAVNNLSATQGREVSLGHCTLLVLGSGLANEDITDVLKYFINKTELHNNCAIIYTNSDVEGLIKGSLREGDASGNLLQQISEYNQKNVFGKPTSLETFFKNHMRATSTNVIGVAELETDAVSNKSKSAVFKNGKFAFKLDDKQTAALNFLQKKNTNVRLVQGSEVFNILSKRAYIYTGFVGEIPTLDITVKIKVNLESNPHASDNFIADLKEQLQVKIEKDIRDVLDHCHTKGADVLNVYDKFRQNNSKAFKKLISEKTNEQFLSMLDLSLQVDVQIIS